MVKWSNEQTVEIVVFQRNRVQKAQKSDTNKRKQREKIAIYSKHKM